MKASIAILLGATTLNCGVSATSYYVSNYGDDTATGTSADMPWKTLSHSSTVRLGPEDSLLLERGSVFADDLLNLAFPSGYIGSFGNTTLPRPQIVRHWAPGVPACLTLLNPTTLTVDGLHFAGCSQAILIDVTTNSTSSDVALTNNFLRDIRWIDEAYNPSKSSWGTGILLIGDGSMENLTISNNVGIRLDTFFGMAGPAVNTLDLNSNTVSKCGFNCVNIEQGNNMRLRNSVFLHDTSPRLFMYGTTDVIIGTVTGDNAIEVRMPPHGRTRRVLRFGFSADQFCPFVTRIVISTLAENMKPDLMDVPSISRPRQRGSKS